MTTATSRGARFVALLIAGAALLTAIAHATIARTTRGWFEADLRLRAKLAVQSAERSLLRHWSPNDRAGLVAVLDDITRDERIMGAAACSADGEALARTETYPRDFTCGSLASQRAASAKEWATTGELPGGPIHLSAVPIEDGAQTLGFVVLVHDLSFVTRREATTRNLVVVGFLVLAAVTSLVLVVAERVARRGWISALRRAVAGEASRDFQPVVRDLRELADTLARERASSAGMPWTPSRLRSTLTQHLHGERIAIVANREPYIHERAPDGSIRVVHPASGLVTALEPVMRACSGVWIAHGSGSADRETVDAGSRVKVPPGEESYVIRRVWLEEEEEAGYYYGFSNEGLWPLCHVAHTRPVFREGDWHHYRRVNERFAEAVCEEVDVDDPIVLVQDYHFALAPRMIRDRLPRATILAFWHVPWPNAERFGICPWRDEILDGLLGASILGFHTQQHCNHFLDAVDARLEARIDRESNAVVQRSRRTLVRPYPISIDWPVRWLRSAPPVEECRRSVHEELGLAPDVRLGLGVDRLDYTKGIEERFQAVDELLARHPEWRGRFTFVQLAAPSRSRIPAYQALERRVEDLADRINGRWGTPGWRPIVLHRAHHEPPTVFRFYRAADLCYVSSVHDGMNLVAKEFVAAREDERGVLVLSEFTGAARELTEALIVNPYDVGEAGAALAAALAMSPQEQADRMAAMRRLLSELNVYRWAGRMLVDAAELRRRERLTGRLQSASGWQRRSS